VRLPDDLGLDAGRRFECGDQRARSGPQLAAGSGERPIGVRRDQSRAALNEHARRAEPLVREVVVDPDDDEIDARRFAVDDVDARVDERTGDSFAPDGVRGPTATAGEHVRGGHRGRHHLRRVGLHPEANELLRHALR
jgi:hypothetical protein